MSRHYFRDGAYIVLSPDECRHLADDYICTNGNCKWYMDAPPDDFCKRNGGCANFKKEERSVDRAMKKRLVKKITSRKLWVSVCSFASLIVTATGGTQNEAAQVASIIMAGATVIGYVVGEGLADAAGAAGAKAQAGIMIGESEYGEDH